MFALCFVKNMGDLNSRPYIRGFVNMNLFSYVFGHFAAHHGNELFVSQIAISI